MGWEAREGGRVDGIRKPPVKSNYALSCRFDVVKRHFHPESSFLILIAFPSGVITQPVATNGAESGACDRSSKRTRERETERALSKRSRVPKKQSSIIDTGIMAHAEVSSAFCNGSERTDRHDITRVIRGPLARGN